ncbi:MAG: hypothetical protein AB7I32_10945 [Gammaproteobacteria bacterium]
MSTKPSQKAIARALGVSASRISQLKREGMDVSSIAAAEAWCKRRLDPARRFGQRHSIARTRTEPAALVDDGDDDDDGGDGGDDDPTDAARIGIVCVLAEAANALIAEGHDVAPYRQALLARLSEMPPDCRRFVAIPKAVWTVLRDDAADAPPSSEFVFLVDDGGFPW